MENVSLERKFTPVSISVAMAAICVLACIPYRSGCAQGRSSETSSTDLSSADSSQRHGALGFSIESEMLTYRALESNSEAVGCDVAAYLSGVPVDFGTRQPGSRCETSSGAGGRQSVIVAPFNSSAFEDFRLWRAEMALMRELHDRAASLCPEAERGIVNKAAKAVVSGVIPGGGSALSIAQGLLGMVRPGGGETPVVGTIEDQAFMDGVARELRQLNVTVLMPSAYSPFTIAAPAAKESPFLSALDSLVDLRACLVRTQTGAGQQDAGAANVERLIAEIDSYTAALQGFAAPAVRSSEATTSAGSSAPGRQREPTAPAATTLSVASATPPALLLAVLAGDGFAQELGVDPATGLLAIDNSSPHVLLVKALESGGTVASTGGFFSSSTRYSGGSVGTFALFNLDGELECSGNVYEYGGSIDSSHFEQNLRAYTPDPSKQYIFQRGSCQRAHPQ